MVCPNVLVKGVGRGMAFRQHSRSRSCDRRAVIWAIDVVCRDASGNDLFRRACLVMVTGGGHYSRDAVMRQAAKIALSRLIRSRVCSGVGCLTATGGCDISGENKGRYGVGPSRPSFN